jgi:hypothetical protein
VIAVDVPTGLTQSQRAALEVLVRKLRRSVETDLRSTAEGRFGLHLDGHLESADALTLTSSEQADREELLDVLVHLRSLGESSANAVSRLLREASFTHVNRLLAIRVAEGIGVLPESLGRGSASDGFAEVAEVAPLVGDDYAGYLDLCARELAADAPNLFDPRNPMLRLPMSPTCLSSAVDLIDAVDSELWTAADTFGWAYQFFNSEDDRREMREGSSAPRNSRELAVRNQFFTPRYVVDFLVQNTLGRRLLPSMPELSAHLPLLLDAPTEPGLPVDLREIKILDPASGSGHFLLGAYDLLEIAWGLQGVDPATAAPNIVNSLWGVDIDPRCAQVAAAAIVMRARRRTAHGDLPRPHIVCARGLPLGAHTMVPGLDFDESQLLKAVEEALADAPNLGVLLKAELRMNSAFDQAFGSAESPTLTGSSNVVEREHRLRQTVARLSEVAQATPAERLLAAEIDDALRLWEVCRTRFSAVLMNPPFGEPVPETKSYLESAYPDCPGREILCAFVERGVELCASDGYLGALTSRGPLFLKTGASWRQNTILHNRLQAAADLGFGVMEQALVEAAAYVIAPRLSGPERDFTVLRLLREMDRPLALETGARNAREGNDDRRIFRVSPADLAAIPGAPLAYWMDPSLRRLFASLPAIEGSGVAVRQGMASGDDGRFVRLMWEVPPDSVARTRDESRQGRRWVPYAKGGDYSPYWADIHLVVDWEDDGRRIREYEGSRPQNTQFFFSPGLTWPLRTASGFGLRALPAGCGFGHKGPSIFAEPEDLWELLAWLQSRIAAALIQPLLAAGDETSSGGASKSYEVGVIQRLPRPTFTPEQARTLGHAAKRIATLRRSLDFYDETTQMFSGPDLVGTAVDAAEAAARRRADVAVEVLALAADAERMLVQALGLPDSVGAYLNAEVGPSVDAYPDVSPNVKCLEDLARPLEAVIQEALADRGGARFIANSTFVADRQLEVLAHVYGVHPSSIERVRRAEAVLPVGSVRQIAADRFSLLMGVALGRWKAVTERLPLDLDLDLLAPIATRPPGMAEETADAPLLLLDEPGHVLDIELRLTAAAASVWGAEATTRLADICEALGVASIRDVMRRVFWRDHLSRYSKSRRQAPIYWPISVPSRRWGIWLCAPRLSREALFAVAAHADRRVALSADLVSQLAQEQPSTGRTAKHIATELAFERDLQVELGEFRNEARQIADWGWEPDLDDGFVLCAAAMSKLLPQWREPAVKRREIKAGRYAWADVSKWADRL